MRTSWRARARCSSPPWRIRLLMLSPPARQVDQAALHLRAVEACAQGELPRRQEPRRSGDALDQVQCSETLRGVDPDLPHRRLALRAPAARARARRSRGRSRPCRGTPPTGRRRTRAPPRCRAAPSAPRGALPAQRAGHESSRLLRGLAAGQGALCRCASRCGYRIISHCGTPRRWSCGAAAMPPSRAECFRSCEVLALQRRRPAGRNFSYVVFEPSLP